MIHPNKRRGNSAEMQIRRGEVQILVYLKKGGCEHENSEADEQKNVEKNPFFLRVFVTFLENL